MDLEHRYQSSKTERTHQLYKQLLEVHSKKYHEINKIRAFEREIANEYEKLKKNSNINDMFNCDLDAVKIPSESIK